MDTEGFGFESRSGFGFFFGGIYEMIKFMHMRREEKRRKQVEFNNRILIHTPYTYLRERSQYTIDSSTKRKGQEKEYEKNNTWKSSSIKQ